MTEKKAAAKPSKAPTTPGLDGLAELQAEADANAAKGCIGEPVDPKPNYEHSVAGVTEKE